MHWSTPERVCPAGETFDVLIIGGGINGVAIARECARAGKRALIIDQKDFASGTTSRSTRIIHGGLRYLEYGEINLVRESLRERDRLLCQSPHLVRPLEFLLVLPKGREQRPFPRNAFAIRTALWLYHRFAGRSRRSTSDFTELERQLDAGHTFAIYSYDDAQCEFPERLVAEWLADFLAADGLARNYTEALEIKLRNGHAAGARLRDTLSGQEFDVEARQIVNASGPWVDFLLASSGLSQKKLIGGVRGSHLVLPQFPGAPEQVVYTEALDGRPFFVCPWNDQVLVGTTEVADSGNPTDSQPSTEETEYLFRSFSRLFPHSGLTPACVRYSFSGVRPLPFSPGAKMSAITRRHLIHDHKEDGAAGLFSIVGGKLTTAASLGRETARKLGLSVAEPATVHATSAPANGIESSLRQWAHLVACKAKISESSAHAVASMHGRRALAIASAAALDSNLRATLCSHSPHIVAEALQAFSHESAVTLGDVLLRRVPVALGQCWSESCSFEAASRIGVAMGWSSARINSEVESFEEERTRFLHPKPERVSVG